MHLLITAILSLGAMYFLIGFLSQMWVRVAFAAAAVLLLVVLPWYFINEGIKEREAAIEQRIGKIGVHHIVYVDSTTGAPVQIPKGCYCKCESLWSTQENGGKK
ncbi:MAG: hypothetical protein ACTTIC_03620 [Helicobacteraceae bacterium]